MFRNNKSLQIEQICISVYNLTYANTENLLTLDISIPQVTITGTKTKTINSLTLFLILRFLRYKKHDLLYCHFRKI